MPSPLPAHYEVSRSQFLFSVASIVAAAALLAAVAVRLGAQVESWSWWYPIAFLGGVAVADFASGLVHWGADTWGRDDAPIVGRRLLVPFRVHHVNPDDLLRRSFVDANGDVAFVTVPVLAGLLLSPLDAAWHRALAVTGLGACALGMLTNQIHQWAHMAAPPRAVRLLQAARLLLRRDDHAAHHECPYDVHYCITTGWCNRPLEAIGFFRRLERLVTRIIGVEPRQDDRRYDANYRAGSPQATM